MKILDKLSNIHFLNHRKKAFIFSAVLMLVTILSVVVHGGLRYGIDFSGGTLIQIKFKEAVDVPKIRDIVDSLDINGGEIQEFGNPRDVVIHIQNGTGGHEPKVEKIKQALKKNFGNDSFIVERVEMVGPKVGKDLSQKALLSLIYALVGILIYVSYRFEFRFALASVIALAHDTIITVGAFSLFDKEFTLPVVAALLTVIGYSLNDTIVVFDRVRENLRLKRSLEVMELINVSINQTLGRTIITSGTTMFVVLSIFIYGGSAIHNFAFALIVGIVIGTYSSIFIASPVLILWPGTTTQTLSLSVKRK